MGRNYWNYSDAPVSSFEGLIFKKINVSLRKDEIVFLTDTGAEYHMFHDQDCCESVTIEDITGDIKDLIDTPILHASERTKDTDDVKRGLLSDDYSGEAEEWTFYEFRTIKGSVTIRWYGSSNGYYGTSVSLQVKCKQ